MTEHERKEIEQEIIFFKFILDFHNQQAESGNFMYGISQEESLEHRLDAMEAIARLEKKLKDNS